MNERFLKLASLGSIALLPLITLAEETRTFKDLVNELIDALMLLFPVVIALMLFAFFWGLVRFTKARADGKDKELAEGQQMMFWGVIGIFVVVSAWGIVGLFRDFFFTEGLTAPPTPRNLLE